MAYLIGKREKGRRGEWEKRGMRVKESNLIDKNIIIAELWIYKT
jgi:hypothetical protein